MKRIPALALLFLVAAVPRQVSGQVADSPATATITGVVTGDGGQPLEGAEVGVAGTELVSVAGAGGRYTLGGVPAGSHTVRVSFLGYGVAERAVTVAAGETETLDVQLTTQALALDELVAVGYATQQRQDVTGSISAVQMANIENRPIRGATEALTAQLPGVRVVTSTGAPGSGAQVQVRGVSAIGAGSTPLYVVDGVPITTSDAVGSRSFTVRSPLADIPPSEIESITVLKDASAAAIYGSQASNGVVIITTRRGGAFDQPQIDVQAYTGMQTVDWGRFPELANATEFAVFQQRLARQRLWIEDGAAGPIPGPDDSRIPEEWRSPEQYGEGTNWYEEVLETAPTNSITASVSGGSERVRAYLSAGYLTQDGMLLESNFKRMNARANLDANLSDRLTLGFSLAPTYSIRNLPVEGGTGRTDGLGNALHVWPTDTPYDENGNLKPLVWGWVTGPTERNPVNVLRETVDEETTFRALATTYLDYRLMDGVELRSRLNVDWRDGQARTFEPSTLWTATGPSIPEGTFVTSRSLGWLSENTITVDRQISDAHRFQLLGGFTAQQTKSEGSDFTGEDFPDDEIQTLNAAATITGNTNESTWSMASVFGRLNYSLLDRYVLTATLRTDGSSRFGEASRWGTFPSAAVAWNFSREPFMENVNWVQDAKLRLSLGFTGNNQIGNFASIGEVEGADYVFGGSQAPGTRLESLGNPDLAWERTREWNIGLDAALLTGRLSITADAYRRTTENLLLSLELPTASGFGSVTANQGSIQNQGFEVGVTTVNVDRPNFRWTTNANISVNRNKALNLGASDTLLSGTSLEGVNTHITVVGQPIARFYGYRILGIYTPEDIADANVAKYAGAVAGDVKFKDVNGDGVIRQREDFEVIGNPWPDFTWGMTNNITYDRFDLRMTVDGQVGGQRLNRNLGTIENIDGPFNVSKKYVETMFVDWDSIGDGLTPGAGNTSAGGRRAFRDVNDRWVEDAGFVWIRNVQLTYNLPERLAGLLNSRRASVYVSIENPYIFTPFHGNPMTEPNQNLVAGGSPNTPNLSPGVDNFSYPIPRFWTFGINLGF